MIIDLRILGSYVQIVIHKLILSLAEMFGISYHWGVAKWYRHGTLTATSLVRSQPPQPICPSGGMVDAADSKSAE